MIEHIATRQLPIGKLQIFSQICQEGGFLQSKQLMKSYLGACWRLDTLIKISCMRGIYSVK